MAPTAPNKKIPRKFYHHFLFKAFIITVFLVVIPLFPSEPPDFVTPSVFTRGWELLHLIFVGIAVSYGLFSRKNDDDSESDKHEINQTKTDSNAQSVMSRLLNVSSVFDDETDVSSPSGSSVTDDHVKKVETWSSKYVRNEPMLVVAEQNSGISREKPLLLPVRSLKSRVSDDEKGGDFVDNHGVSSRVYNRSNTTPIVKGFSRNSRSLSRNDLIGLVHGEEDSGIISSSRGHGRSFSSTSFNEFSGDVNGNIGIGSLNSGVRPSNDVIMSSNNNSNNSEVSRSLHRSNSRNSRRHSSASHGDFDGGGVEDSGGKVGGESVVLPSPIPWRSRSGRLEVKAESNDSSTHLPPKEPSPPPKEPSPPPKVLSPPPKVSSPRNLSSSPTPTLESGGKTVEDFGRRKINYSSRLPPPPPPPPPPFQTSNKKDMKKTTNKPSNDSSDDGFNKSTNGVNSVRSYRPKEVESHPETESHEINSDGYFGRTKSSFSEYPKETQDFLERVLLESDDESESEGESYKEERTETTKIDAAPSEIVSDEGPDVDKKADEFIAKFREQIRLQRIESIKKSTGQLNRSSLR